MTSTTTTSTISSTIATFSQCFSSKAISDSTRLVTAPYNGLCDKNTFTFDITWVRFIYPGGTQLATSPPNTDRCGAHVTGWYRDTMPSAGTMVTGTVCYHYNGNNCMWNNTIQVVNCGPFYVFGLVAPPGFKFRYCTV